MMTRKRILLAAMAMLFSLGQSVALAGPYKGRFTGLFYGQGEGCWGTLFIRTRTISWTPGILTCDRTAYTIVDESLHTPFENYDYIVFKLHHLSNGCPFPYIGLYYYQSKDEAEAIKADPRQGLFYDWGVAGFDSYNQFKHFPYKGIVDESVDTNPAELNVLMCNLPYGERPFPYGFPIGSP